MAIVPDLSLQQSVLHLNDLRRALGVGEHLWRLERICPRSMAGSASCRDSSGQVSQRKEHE